MARQDLRNRVNGRTKVRAIALTVCLAAASASAAAPPKTGPTITVDTETVTVGTSDHVVLRYKYAGVPSKPYVRELYSPAGVNILRDAPHDHLHHHALMFGVAVNGVSYWEESDKAGKQMHNAFLGINADASGAGFRESLHWQSPEQKNVASEFRSVQVHTGPSVSKLGATLVTWNTSLGPDLGGSITLSGDHYDGLGMRFVESMDGSGTFMNATGKEGTVFRGDERLVRAKWCAYAAKAEGKPVTVAMFDHPENTRHPATFFTMTKPFAYLSATLNLHEYEIDIRALSRFPALRYGVAVWDGHVTKDHIDRTYDLWRDLCSPKWKKQGTTTKQETSIP